MVEVVNVILRSIGRDSSHWLDIPVLCLLVLLFEGFKISLASLLELVVAINLADSSSCVHVFLAEVLWEALFVWVLRLVPMLWILMHLVFNQVKYEWETLNARHEFDWLVVLLGNFLGLFLQLHLLCYYRLKPVQDCVLGIVLLLLAALYVLDKTHEEHFYQVVLPLLHIILVEQHELI